MRDSQLHGMGWFIEPSFLGKTRLSHAGGFEGYIAYVSFMPEEDLGVVILTNMHASRYAYLIADTVYSRLLGKEEIDLNDRLKKAKKLAELSASALKARKIMPKSGTALAHQLEGYTGEYENPGFGKMNRQLDQGILKASFNGTINFDLEHFHYEVFNVTNLKPLGREFAYAFFQNAKMMFKTDVRGDVSQVELMLYPDLTSEGGIIFTRK